MGTAISELVGRLRNARTDRDLAAVIADIRDQAGKRQRASEKRANFWAKAYYLFGFPAATLGALAGLLAFNSISGRIPAAILACISAFCSTASLFLNAERKRVDAEDMAARWDALCVRARADMSRRGAELASAADALVDDYERTISLPLRQNSDRMVRLAERRRRRLQRR